MSQEQVKTYCRFVESINEEDTTSGTIQFSDKVVTFNEFGDFTFDKVFAPDYPLTDLYVESIQQSIVSALNGENTTLISVGPDLEGFSYRLSTEDITSPDRRALLPRIISDIFFEIRKHTEESLYSVQVSLYEVYKEELHDLLNPLQNSKLKVCDCGENGIQIMNLTHVFSYNEDMLLGIITTALQRRMEPLNGNYARCHTVIQLDIVKLQKEEVEIYLGSIKIVDLASPHNPRRVADARDLKEIKYNNKSMFTLGSVIESINDGKIPPYRNSLLTFVLKNSFGGNCHTTLLFNCSASKEDEEDTLTNLRFCERCKMITNVVRGIPFMNQDNMKFLISTADSELDKWRAILSNLDPNIQNQPITIDQAILSSHEFLSQMVDKLKTDLRQSQENNKELEEELEEEREMNEELKDDINRLQESQFWKVRDLIMVNQNDLLSSTANLCTTVNSLDTYLSDFLATAEKRTAKSVKEFQSVAEDKINYIITELMILFQKIESHDMRYCECISRINNYNEMGLNSRPSSPIHSPTHRMSRMSMTSFTSPEVHKVVQNSKEQTLPYNSTEEIDKYQIQIQVLKQQISALTDELHNDVTSKEQSDLLAKQFVNLETKWKDDADKILENERLKGNQARYDCDKLKKEISQLNDQLADFTEENNKLQDEVIKEILEKLAVETELEEEKEKCHQLEFSLMEKDAFMKSAIRDHPPCEHLLFQSKEKQTNTSTTYTLQQQEQEDNNNNNNENSLNNSNQEVQLYALKNKDNNTNKEVSGRNLDENIYYICDKCHELFYLKNQYGKFVKALHSSITFTVNNLNILGESLCNPPASILNINTNVVREGLNDIKRVIKELMKKYDESLPQLEKLITDINNTREFYVNTLNEKIRFYDSEKIQFVEQCRYKVNQMLETHQSLQEKYEKEITEVSLSKLELTMKLVEIRKQFRNNVDNEYKLRCEMMEKQIIKLWKDKDVLEKELKGSKQVEDLITVLQAKYGVTSPSHKVPTSIQTNSNNDNDDVVLLNPPPKKRQSIKGVTILKEIDEDVGIAEGEEINETSSEKKTEDGEEIENNSSKEEKNEKEVEIEENENKDKTEQDKQDNSDNNSPENQTVENENNNNENA